MLCRVTVIQAKCYTGECELGEWVHGEWVLGESVKAKCYWSYNNL